MVVVVLVVIPLSTILVVPMVAVEPLLPMVLTTTITKDLMAVVTTITVRVINRTSEIDIHQFRMSSCLEGFVV